MKKRGTKAKAPRTDSPRPEVYHPSAAVCGGVLLALALLMTVPRLHTYDEPFDMDITTYSIIGSEMHSGRYLYSELWDHKPPAVYASYYVAQGAVGSGRLHVFLMGLATAIATLLGVYFAASQAVGATAGLLAAAFWAIVGADLHMQANQPNAEAFMNPCLIWTFALLLRLPTDRIAVGRTVAIGALIALASLYKSVAVSAGGLMVAHVVAAGFARPSLIQATVVAAVGFFAWAGVFVFFAATDRLAPFVSTVFEFNQMYAGSALDNIVAGLRPDLLFAPVLLQFWPLIIPAIAGLLFTRSVVSRRARLLLAAFGITTFLSVALPGKFFHHYYQLWLPFLCVSAAWAIAALYLKVNHKWIAGACVAGVIALSAFPQVYNLSLSPDQWAEAKFGDRLILGKRAAAIVNRLLRREEKFFQWGHNIELYAYAERRPAAGEFRSGALLNGTRKAERTAQLVADLESNLPELVIVVADHEFPRDHPVPKWIIKNYRPITAQACDREIAARFVFLVRANGRLAGLIDGPCLE